VAQVCDVFSSSAAGRCRCNQCICLAGFVARIGDGRRGALFGARLGLQALVVGRVNSSDRPHEVHVGQGPKGSLRSTSLRGVFFMVA